MQTYKLTRYSSIKRSDGADIPADPENGDYAAYLRWLEAGNIPDPAAEPTNVELNTSTLAAIAALESRSQRSIREILLGDSTAIKRLQEVNDQIAHQRAQMRY